MTTPSARRMVRALWRAGSDFLYPPSCPHCDTPLERADDAGGGDRLCETCLDELRPDARDSCACCGAPVGPYLNWSPGCHYCRNDRFAFDSVVRYGVYDGALRNACLRIKHRCGIRLTFCLADLLWDSANREMLATNAAAVAAVPRHWSQALSRDHYAAETLAAALARRMDVPFRGDVLRKLRRTARQSSLLPNERRTNLRGAFAAELSEDLRGATLLLVDDVLTTGSTAHQSARALRNAGAGRVVVAVIARGLGR